jgi:hypothetical protein
LLRTPEGRPAGLPDWPFSKGLPRHPCWLFLQRIYSHGHLLYGKAARRGLDYLAAKMRQQFGIFMIIHFR